MITRRLFLRNTAVASVAGTAVVAPAAASLKLTPDERIEAALEEIKDAILEMRPDSNCRICRIDGDDGQFDTFMVISNLSFLKPGEVQYLRNGKVVRRESGDA
jgi:hypothetical protein